MLRFPTPEDNKRLEQELLKLNDQDMLVLELFKNVASSKGKPGEQTIVQPYEILGNNEHSLTIDEIGTSMYKLQCNGRIRLKRINDAWVYTSHYFN